MLMGTLREADVQEFLRRLARAALSGRLASRARAAGTLLLLAPLASAGARAELSGHIAQQVISTRLAIGVCARLGLGPFSKELCNPSALPWLPVTVINGPRYDFSRFC
jgi:hypothetical protein